MAFGFSFMLLCSLTLLVVRAAWNNPMVGLVGGLCVAAPLAIAALVPELRP